MTENSEEDRVNRRLVMLYVLAAVLVILVVILSAVLWFKVEEEERKRSDLVGRVAPDFRLEDVYREGEYVERGLLEGEVFAVNFFASWCTPCRAEHPLLSRLDVPIVGIGWKDSKENIKKFLEELGNVYAYVGQDSKGEAMIDYGMVGIPETLIVGKRGFIRYHRRGVLREGDLDRIVILLKELAEE